MNEAELQGLVTDTAATFGWWRAHFRPARTAHGWRTPGTYEAGKGWPDLQLVGEGTDPLLVWELKAVGGIVDHDQVEWLLRFSKLRNVEAAVVTPHNVDDYALPRLMRTRRYPDAGHVVGFAELRPVATGLVVPRHRPEAAS
jgi:hypothetical protein